MNTQEDTFFIVPRELHDDLVRKAYAERGFDEDECEAAAKFSAHATTHGIRTHNALKALHLDDLFGSKAGGCKPSATIIRKESVSLPRRFGTANISWDRQLPMKR